LVLAIRCAATPYVFTVIEAREWWVSPSINSRLWDRDDILMSHEQGGLQVVLRTLPGEEQAVGVYHLEREIRMYTGKCVFQVRCKVVHDVPPRVLTNWTEIIEALSRDLDGA
jgi:hypothetical protein